jgi:hypothetical protein
MVGWGPCYGYDGYFCYIVILCTECTKKLNELVYYLLQIFINQVLALLAVLPLVVEPFASAAQLLVRLSADRTLCCGLIRLF